jgi:hypothetical protein
MRFLQRGVMEMSNKLAKKSQPLWVYDYSAAIANAVAWLGDRYLLAKPIKTTPAARPGPVRAPIFRGR